VPAVSTNVNVVANPGTSWTKEDPAAFQVPASYGIAWSGYKGVEGNSPCKTLEDADNDWSQLGAFNIVRVYGTDCNQPSNSLQLAQKYNKKVVLGAFYLEDATLRADLQTMINSANANGGWANVDTVTVGNEDVNKGTASPGQVIAAVSTARTMLRSAGYNGPIVHVDTQNAILAHPELCGHAAGDYIAANIHPFFNPNTPASQAGNFISGQVQALQQCGATSWKRRNTRVRVMETGWPKGGDANGAAVPSKENQMQAISSIKKALGNDVFLFSAFNNYWMPNNAGTFNTEHYWGIFDN
jgi:exo-beta-1,3-glucanase (GH17 family)